MRVTTERLALRNFQRGDAEGLHAYLREPTATCFLSLKLASIEEAATEVEKRRTGDEFIAVRSNSTGRLTGDLFAMAEEDTFSVGWISIPSSEEGVMPRRQRERSAFGLRKAHL